MDSLRKDKDLSHDVVRQLLTSYVFNHDALSSSFIQSVLQDARTRALGDHLEQGIKLPQIVEALVGAGNKASILRQSKADLVRGILSTTKTNHDAAVKKLDNFRDG